MRLKIQGLYPLMAGLIFLVLSFLTFVRPEILSYYSIGIDTAPARIAIRAMIGGGELGIASLLLFGARLGFSIRQRSLIAAIIFLCAGLARIIAGMGEGTDMLLEQPLREASIEVVLALVGFWAAIMSASQDGKFTYDF